jgi:CspA family cold shock protein
LLLSRFVARRTDRTSSLTSDAFVFHDRSHIRAAGTRSFKENEMTIGTVKFFNTSKGFGFIAPEDGGKDVFVHASAVEAAGMRSLAEGQKVSFDVQPDARGSKAANLKAV